MFAGNVHSIVGAVLVAVIWGLSFIFTKGLLDYLSPFQLLGLRFALAALSLTLLVSLRLVKINTKVEHLPPLLKVAIWQPVLYFVFETYGVKLTTASESGVIIALAPIAITLLSIIILGERTTWAQGAFIAAAVAGVVLMTLGGTVSVDGTGSSHLLGILMLLGAVIAAGFYNIYSRQAASRFSPLEITFIMMWVGAIVFNAIGLVQSYFSGSFSGYLSALQNISVAGGLFYLGILSSVVAFFLLNLALSSMPASRVAVFLNLIPVVALLAGVTLYGERLGPWQLAGCCLVLLGVWGANYFIAKPGEQSLGVKEGSL